MVLLEAAALVVDEVSVLRFHEKLGQNRNALAVISRKDAGSGGVFLGSTSFPEAVPASRSDVEKERAAFAEGHGVQLNPSTRNGIFLDTANFARRFGG